MTDYEEQVRNIHKQLKFDFGSLEEEFPEQVMSVTFLTGTEKVLELGGNIGRNSMIIAHILNKNNNDNFVTLETNPEDAAKLAHNRHINGFRFHIENAALSQRKLIQNGWVSIPSDVVLDGYTEVNTITWKELQNKYNIAFDTLVLDCEGAFFFILIDTPEILDNIKLVIMENDYWNDERKSYVQTTLRNYNFELVYQRPLINYPFQDFYQVWKRS